MNNTRCLAHFRPQAWIDGYAVDVDGAKSIDVTGLILSYGKEQSLNIRNGTYESDALYDYYLAQNPNEQRHQGPFEVECEEAIASFWNDMLFAQE